MGQYWGINKKQHFVFLIFIVQTTYSFYVFVIIFLLNKVSSYVYRYIQILLNYSITVYLEEKRPNEVFQFCIILQITNNVSVMTSAYFIWCSAHLNISGRWKTATWQQNPMSVLTINNPSLDTMLSQLHPSSIFRNLSSLRLFNVSVMSLSLSFRSTYPSRNSICNSFLPILSKFPVHRSLIHFTVQTVLVDLVNQEVPHCVIPY
jgi:hypothetical protein